MDRLIRTLKSFWNSRGVACVPPQVMLQITGRSSLRCHHCALEDRGPGRRPFDELDPQWVLEFLPRLIGVRTLMLYGRGEPLLYPDLELVIWNARKHIPSVCITTAAAQLTRVRSARLAVAGLSRLQVALDGLDPRYHRRVRGGDLLATLAALECFSRTTGLPVSLSPVITEENIGGLHELLELKRRIP